LKQRNAVDELAAFLEDETAKSFMKSLGYQPDFKEIELAAEPLADFSLPESTTVTPYDGELDSLETLMSAAFDDEVLPVIHYNIESDDRFVYLMKRDGELLASASLLDEGDSELWITALAVDPAEQGKGYGK